MWIPASARIATPRIGYFQLEEWCGSVRVFGGAAQSSHDSLNR